MCIVYHIVSHWYVVCSNQWTNMLQGCCPLNSCYMTLLWHPGPRMFWNAMGLNDWTQCIQWIVQEHFWSSLHCFYFHLFSTCVCTCPQVLYINVLLPQEFHPLKYQCALPIHKRCSDWQRVMAPYLFKGWLREEGWLSSWLWCHIFEFIGETATP